MDYKWELFSVGMKRAEWTGLPQGLVMEWADACGLTLFVFFDKPYETEKREISARSPFEIRFKDIDGIGFFSVKFGQLPWSDCSFTPNLYPEVPKFEKPEKGMTYPLNIMLIDTFNGELKLIRTIALGKEFADHFRNWCLASLDKNISKFYYKRVVEEVFKKYVTSEDLAEVADIRWVCLPDEAEPKREEKERE